MLSLAKQPFMACRNETKAIYSSMLTTHTVKTLTLAPSQAFVNTEITSREASQHWVWRSNTRVPAMVFPGPFFRGRFWFAQRAEPPSPGHKAPVKNPYVIRTEQSPSDQCSVLLSLVQQQSFANKRQIKLRKCCHLESEMAWWNTTGNGDLWTWRENTTLEERLL